MKSFGTCDDCGLGEWWNSLRRRQKKVTARTRLLCCNPATPESPQNSWRRIHIQTGLLPWNKHKRTSEKLCGEGRQSYKTAWCRHCHLLGSCRLFPQIFWGCEECCHYGCWWPFPGKTILILKKWKDIGCKRVWNILNINIYNFMLEWH